MSKTIIIFGIIFMGIGIWFFVSQSSMPEDVIAKNGLHWHSELTIKINGENQDIPAGLGLERLPHNPIHTHDRDSVIHMEFAGAVEKDDLKLGNFFKVWGKTFNKDCIFDNCSGADNQLTMLINGRENFEFESYIMRDGDKIEIIFE